MKTYSVSVIVPVYNVEKYIDDCIKSLINQTYKDINIILVDDGSTDNSGQMCDGYAESDSRIKVIHKENGGVSLARNTAIDYIKETYGNEGYIAFVDSDDIVHEQYIECMINLAEQHQADIVYSGIMDFSSIIEIPDLNDIVCKQIKNLEYKVFDNEYGVRHIYSVCYTPNAFSKLIKIKLLETNRFPIDIHRAEDMAVTYRIIYEAKTIVWLKNIEPYYYRKTPGSLMSNSSYIFYDFLVRKELYNLFEGINNNDETLMKLAKQTKRFYLDSLIQAKSLKDKELYNGLKKEGLELSNVMWKKHDKNFAKKLKLKLLTTSPRLWMYVNLIENKIHKNELLR